MKQLLGIVLAVALLLGLMQMGEATLAQAAGVRYFSATGHNVQGGFLEFFERYGGEEVFGLPRTEEIQDGGLTVQYFQKVRMEYHPGNPAPYRVQLSLLGDMLGYRAAPLRPSAHSRDSATRRYFPETGHTVCYAFLQFFDAHGGVTVFGYPITELTMERGRVVQYFQRARLEHHPENADHVQITVGDLCEEYIQRRGVPASHLEPVAALVGIQPSPDTVLRPMYILTPEAPAAPKWIPDEAVPTPRPVDRFRVVATVKYPITGQGGYQTVYVRATDEWGQPLHGAKVEARVHFRDGVKSLHGDDTGADGHSSLSFGVGHPPPGYTVIIDISVSYGGRTTTAATSFIPWW
jgi:hypothetical protein